MSVLGSSIDARIPCSPPQSALEKHCSTCIAEGKKSVFDSVRELQRMISTLAFNQTVPPSTSWNQAQTVLQHGKHCIEVSKLTSGIQRMQEDLLEKMYDLSGGTPVQYTIPTGHTDDLTSTGRGESWLKGCYTEPQEHGLMHAMVKKGLWNLSQLDERGVLSWNRVSCREFMNKAADIVDLIMGLVHMGAGPPLRGEEIIRDQISNGIQPRTIYFNFGRMLAIRRHSKNTNEKGSDPFNACYFPKKLGDAICYYLLVIRPLERLVAKRLYNDEKQSLEYDLYLYVKHGERITSPQCSLGLERLTRKYIGVGVTLKPLRHIMIAFRRAYVEELPSMQGNTIGDAMSSHSTPTAIENYAVEHGIPPGSTSNNLLDIQDWCDLYHNAIGLGERTGPLIPLRTKRKLIRELASLSSMDPGDHGVAAVVTTVLKELGVVAYKSGLDELRSCVTKEIWRAVAHGLEQAASDENPHRGSDSAGISSRPEQLTESSHPPPETFLPADPLPLQPRQAKRKFSGGEEPPSKRSRPETPTSRETPQHEPLPQSTSQLLDHAQDPSRETTERTPGCSTVPLPSQTKSTPDAELLTALGVSRKDSSATFKSTFQMELLRSVLDRKYTVAVIPTGGGKSVAFEVPPAIQGQLTVAAFPYRVILAQVKENAETSGLAAEHWVVNTPRDVNGVRLVLTQFETLTNTAFIE